MFAKLKKKIVEEEGVEEGELTKKYVAVATTPGSPGSRNHRGSPANLSRHGSSSSLSSQVTESKKAAETTADSLQVELSQRSDQVRRLEAKLDGYSAMLKDMVKAKERLETALEKQQEASTKKIQEMNEEFQVRRSKMVDKLALAVQKKEEELNIHIQSLEKEKTDIQDQLQKVSMDKFKKQEESEELQGFHVQELAKVKHMFVNSQEELHKCKADLVHTQEKLDESMQQAEKLVSELGSAREGFNKLRQRRDELIKLKTSAEDNASQQERLKKSLEERLHSYTTESQEKSKRLLLLEGRLTNTQDELESLRRESEIYKTQAAAQMNESESTNKHMKEKVRMLEQRLQDHSLTDDEQMKAVISERDALEKKLEESLHELIDLKTSSADKISSLEQQISHLNIKMAEDTEEVLKQQKDVDAIKRRHTDEMSSLQAKLDEVQQQARAVSNLAAERDTWIATEKSLSEDQLNAAQAQMAETKRQSMEMKKQLQDRIASLESKMTGLSTATDFEKSEAEHKITRLESQNEEYLTREFEHEKQITQIEEEKSNVTASLNLKSKECEGLTRDMDEIKERLEEMSKRALAASTTAMDSHKEVDRLRRMVEDKDTSINRMEQDNETLKRWNLETAQTLEDKQRALQTGHEEAQRALFEKAETNSLLKQTVGEKEEEMQLMKKKMEELEERLSTLQASTNGFAEADDVDTLKRTIEDQEQQLSEKNKTIKMQQQRMADLKKTLQRELKLQNSTGYDSPEEPIKDRDRAPVLTSTSNSSSLAPPHGNTASFAEFLNVQGITPSPHRSLLDRQDLREVNFQYLRHVVFKFMSSTDHEAKQLLKAVSTLLEFTPHEEKLINKTLEWKTSWFGIRPSPKQTVQVSSLAYR